MLFVVHYMFFTAQFCHYLLNRYERLLKRARTADLTSIAALRCLYRTGQDRFGRPVIVFVGKNFPAATIDLELVSRFQTFGSYS